MATPILEEPAVFTATLNWIVAVSAALSPATVVDALAASGGLPGPAPDSPWITAVISNRGAIRAPRAPRRQKEPHDFPPTTVYIQVLHLDRDYSIKCFLHKGVHQLPGVQKNDLSDGHAVIAAWLDLLRSRRFGDLRIISCVVSLMNAKFALRARAPPQSLDLHRLEQLLRGLESTKATGAGTGAGAGAGAAVHIPAAATSALSRCPYRIRSVSKAIDAQQISVKLERGLLPDEERQSGRRETTPTLQINPNGKFTLLGEKHFRAVQTLHTLFEDLLQNVPGLLRAALSPDLPDDGAETDDEEVDAVLAKLYRS